MTLIHRPLPILAAATLLTLIAGGIGPANAESRDSARKSLPAIDPALLADDDRLLPDLGYPAPKAELAAPSDPTRAKRLGPNVGGSDVLAGAPTFFGQQVATTANGHIFVAAQVKHPVGDEDQIQLYRSVDAGQSFELVWTMGGSGENTTIMEMIAPHGGVNRLYIQYQWRDATFAQPSAVRVATFDIYDIFFEPTVATLQQDPGLYQLTGDIASDDLEFGEYYLYSTWRASDNNGDDIWFSRSLDYGATWETPYRIGELSSSDNLQYRNPKIAYGNNGVLHVAWEYTEILQNTFDDALRYRRATNYAASGIASWGAGPVAVTSTSDGDNSSVVDIAASTEGDEVLLAYMVNFNEGDVWTWISDDAGTTWPVAGASMSDFITAASLAYRPSTNEFLMGGQLFTRFNPTTWSEQGFQRATAGSSLSWSASEVFSDVDQSLFFGMPLDLTFDRSRDDQICMAWWGSVDASPTGTVFDATWLDGTTVPLNEPGFPLALSATPLSPPAMVNVDADPFGEIVFTTTGRLHVVSHIGTVPGGWPQNVPNLTHGGAAAVGDLNGDGEMELVIGNDEGLVFAFARDSSLLPGWPVDMGTGAPVHVSIGAVGPPYPRHVVALSGPDMHVYTYRGVNVAPFWRFTSNLEFPAAIGDVDGDGVANIVTTKDSFVHVHELSSPGNLMFRNLFGKTISGPPALADLDRDGDLEIVVPTAEGDVYAMHHDGTDVAGWPWSNPAGGAVLPLAVANNVSQLNPDVSFVQEDGNAHLLFFDGVEQPNHPVTLSPSAGLLSSPIVTNVNRYPANMVATRADGFAVSAQNTGGTPAGWPHALGSGSLLTPASGDLDQDGVNEIVFLLDDRLTVVEVQQPEFNPGGPTSWPMYAYDAQRTSCLECDEDVVTPVVPVASTSRVFFAAPHPNPAPGASNFRFTIAEESDVMLELFDLRGRRVRTLAHRSLSAGDHALSFDGRDDDGRRLARGQYLARLAVDGPRAREVRTRKLLLTR